MCRVAHSRWLIMRAARRRAAMVSEPNVRQAGDSAMSDSGSSTPMRVLLIEDSTDDAELIGAALRRSGIACTVEHVDGEDGFATALDGATPHIVLCDFHVPGFSVRRAIEMLEARALAVPLVVVSRHINDGERDESLRLGAK